MTTNPQTDFDGCRRACRQAGAHTLVYGECEQAPEPEPTVSLSRVYTAADGHPSIGFDTYTVPQLARLIEGAVGDPLRAAAAARAIVHRNAAPAAARVVSAAPTQTDLVELAAAAIWARYSDAEPSRTGLVMANPHAVAAAVLAVLPPPADRAAVLHEAVERLSQVPFANVLTELRRLAAEAQQQPDTETCAECGHPKGAHREGEDPVTPGICGVCEASNPDDAHHDYKAGVRRG